MSPTFRDLFDRPPDGIWVAPGRLNLIGEFTDYNDGFVLPMALDAQTTASVSRREDDVVRVFSADVADASKALVAARLGDLTPKRPSSWSDYVLGVVWSMRSLGHVVRGVDILIESNVPIGAGLSSSAALECAVGLALRDLYAPELGLLDLARLCQRAENLYVGVPSGIMDQTASLCCTVGRVIVFDTRSGGIEQVDFDLASFELELLVIDTLVRHELATSAYADRRAACERAATTIGVAALRDASLEDLEKISDPTEHRRARHVITENARVLEVADLLRHDRLEAVGPVLSEAHRSLRDDFEVTCVEVDLAADTAVEAGALGARMIGGGFGGCVIALIRASERRTVEGATISAFSRRGFPPPHCFTATPAAGAHRVS